MRSTLAVVLLLALSACAKKTPVAAPSAPVASGPTEEELSRASDLFVQAVKDEDARQWKSALEKLRQAGAIRMTPLIRLHIALCEEKQKTMCEALNDYIAAATEARDKEESEVLIASIEGLTRVGGWLRSVNRPNAHAKEAPPPGYIGVPCKPFDASLAESFAMSAEPLKGKGKVEDGKRYTLRNAEGARVAFKQAYAIYPSSKILWNLAMAELDSGKNVDAARHIHIYLASRDPTITDENRETAGKRLSEARKKLGGIQIEAPRTARILIDQEIFPPGYEIDDLVELDPGPHVVIVETDSNRQKKTIKVRLGEVKHIQFESAPHE